MVDPVTLAAAAVALLAQKAGQAFADEAGKSAWTALTRFATFLRDRFRGDPQAGTKLDAIEQHPTDESQQAALAEMIRARIERDPKFGSDLEAALNSARATAIVNHGQFVQVMGNVEKQLTFNAPLNVSGDFNV